MINPDFVRGAKAAADVASSYESVSAHPYRLQDCILMKLNLTRRKKPRANRRANDEWLKGFGLALAEASRQLGAPSGIGVVLRDSGVTLAMLQRAGLEGFDLDELRKCK